MQAAAEGDTLFDPSEEPGGFLKLDRSTDTRIHFVRRPRQASIEPALPDAAATE
jgi:hypothetical protein